MSDREYTYEGEDARKHLEEMEAQSLGPVGSTLLLGPGGLIPFFKVRFTPEMEAVWEAARQGQDIDQSYDWGVCKIDNEITLVLTVQWIYPAARCVLVMPLETWREMLDMYVHSDGLFNITREGRFTGEALAIQADPELVAVVLEVMK